MGRLSETSTGNEARGGTTTDGPYYESFADDPWNQLPDHDTGHWTENDPMTAVTYTNDWHAYWT